MVEAQAQDKEKDKQADSATGMQMWQNISAETKKEILEKIAKVYRDNKCSEEMMEPSVIGERVVNLENFGEDSEINSRLVIRGVFPHEDEDANDGGDGGGDLENDTTERGKITRALKVITANVSNACIDIQAQYQTGDRFFGIKGATRLQSESTQDSQEEVIKPPSLGEALLLHFWATWCPDAEKALKLFEDAFGSDGGAEGAGGLQVKVHALSLDAMGSQVVAYRTLHKLKGELSGSGDQSPAVKYYLTKGKSCKAEKDFGVRGAPLTVLVDPEGYIKFMGHPNLLGTDD